MVACELDFTPAQVEYHLQQLLTILPEIRPYLPSLASSVLAALLTDPPALQPRLLELRAALPDADVALLATCQPYVLLVRPRRVHNLLHRLSKRMGIEDLNQALLDWPS